jgi:hypothetical protein
MAAVCPPAVLSAAAEDKPILEASTETPSPGAILPPADLVRVVLDVAGKDIKVELDECLAEEGFKNGDYAPLLRAVKVSADGARTLWFVRPALKPWCQALYGAHLFQYFWIEERSPNAEPRYIVRYHGGGDAFAIYRRQSHGLNDIEPTGCIATECRSARMAFDGAEYKPVRCSVTKFKDGVGETKERPCKFDGWDNQSSGLLPSEP